MTIVRAIEISEELRAAVAAHAREAYPAECCGYLVGDGTRATRLVRCRNAQADGEHPTHPERGAETGFVIAGTELLEFARSFGGPAAACVVYHSHTNGRAYLSEIDRINATTPTGPSYPVQHLVVGVTDAGATEAALFAWDEPSGGFVEVARWDARC